VPEIRILLLQLGDIGPWPNSGVEVERLKLVQGVLFGWLHPTPAAFPTPPFLAQLQATRTLQLD